MGAFNNEHIPLLPVLSHSNFGPSKQQLQQLGLLAKTNTQPHRHHLSHYHALAAICHFKLHGHSSNAHSL